MEFQHKNKKYFIYGCKKPVSHVPPVTQAFFMSHFPMSRLIRQPLLSYRPLPWNMCLSDGTDYLNFRAFVRLE